MALPTFPNIQPTDYIFKASIPHRESLYNHLVLTYPDVPDTILEHIAFKVSRPIYNISSFSILEIVIFLFIDIHTSAIDRSFWRLIYDELKSRNIS